MVYLVSMIISPWLSSRYVGGTDKVCPPPDSKNKRSDTYVEAKGILAAKYDIHLHMAIGHLRRADGALPNHSSGRKALDLLGEPGKPRYTVWCLLCAVFFFMCNVLRGRYIVRASQPMYGFWFYYMWSKVIGPTLITLHPRLNVRTAEMVDELLE